jgi:phage shock protein E
MSFLDTISFMIIWNGVGLECSNRWHASAAGVKCSMKTPYMFPLIFALSLVVPLCGAELVEVDAAKASEVLVTDAAVTVLDLRTPGEFAEGHLQGAENIDFLDGTFESLLQKLDPEKPYLVHCASGRRSAQAMEVFEKFKFTKIYHLTTGYKSWVAAGKPVVK